ncbi:DNA-binding protein [Roseibium sp.]|uniref:DNA-binding protein n=1 Tax=Roseibium sp. TaxID=1936156 RepID=UPI00391CD206
MTEDSGHRWYQLVVDKFELPEPGFENLHEDVPISLDDALFLPELGGGSWKRSYLVTINELRAAVNRGDLEVERHGKNFRTTRRYIAEWREKCRVHPNQPASGSDLPAKPLTGARSNKPSTSSSMLENKSALDVARMIAQELKKR